MEENVWFLSAVINERFSVMSFIGSRESAIQEAKDFLTHQAGYSPNDCDFITIPIVQDWAYSLVSDRELLAASLLRA